MTVGKTSLNVCIGMTRITPLAPITHFQVLGERCSGTNYLHKLIINNLNVLPTNEYGWKHGFPAFIGARPTSLAVVVVRNAIDWVLSMYRKPWHTSNDMRILEFSEFIKFPWSTIIDKAEYFGMRSDDARIGQRLQYDMHPLSGQMPSNIVELRNLKLTSHLGILNRGINVVLVRHEDIVRRPALFLREISECYSIALLENEIKIPSGKYGWRWPEREKLIGQTPKKMTKKDRDFILNRLNLSQELSLGYQY